MTWTRIDSLASSPGQSITIDLDRPQCGNILAVTDAAGSLFTRVGKRTWHRTAANGDILSIHVASDGPSHFYPRRHPRMRGK